MPDLLRAYRLRESFHLFYDFSELGHCVLKEASDV